jgi:hypothetical protein
MNTHLPKSWGLLLFWFLPSVALGAPAIEDPVWSAGYRFEVLTANGEPANDMMGSGAFAGYRATDHIRIVASFEYVEYDFESPQSYLGLPKNAVEETDSRTRSTLISVDIEQAWGAPTGRWRPFAFAGAGMGYTKIDDIRGTAEGEPYDIRAEGGIETVPRCGAGIRYRRGSWMAAAGAKAERHFADWELEDRLSGRTGEVGDYAAYGGWIELSFYF